MNTALVPATAVDVALAVCRVEDSVVVHLVKALGWPDEQGVALCGGTVVPGRPERLLMQSPCSSCVARAHREGVNAVRDRPSVWVNLGRLAGAMGITARVAA
jgi:hypothetical protein